MSGVLLNRACVLGNAGGGAVALGDIALPPLPFESVTALITSYQIELCPSSWLFPLCLQVDVRACPLKAGLCL